jgi:hypothetical protein
MKLTHYPLRWRIGLLAGSALVFARMKPLLRLSESATTKTLSIGVWVIVFAYVAFMVYRVTR